MSERHPVIIVGAGIIGLASAYHLTKSGLQVTIVDRDPDGDRASCGNAGGIAVTECYPAASPGVWWRVFSWMSDPLGPLAIRPGHAPQLLPWLVRFARASRTSEVQRIARALAALNARVYDDFIPMLADLKMAHHLHRDGALSLYETEEGYRRDAAEWACKRSLGITVEELTAEDAREMEPALRPRVCRAVFTPQWSHVSDPKQLLQALRDWLIDRGVKLRRAEVRCVSADSDSFVTLHQGAPAVVAVDAE